MLIWFQQWPGIGCLKSVIPAACDLDKLTSRRREHHMDHANHTAPRVQVQKERRQQNDGILTQTAVKVRLQPNTGYRMSLSPHPAFRRVFTLHAMQFADTTWCKEKSVNSCVGVVHPGCQVSKTCDDASVIV